jgi:hypothetical protein
VEVVVFGALVIVIAGIVGTLAPDTSVSAASTTTATLSLSPLSGAPGSTVNASGAGYGHSMVQLLWDGVADGMPQVQANGNGSFSTTLKVPSGVASGSHSVSAITSGTGRSASSQKGRGAGGNTSGGTGSAVFSVVVVAVTTPAATPVSTVAPTVAPTAAPTQAPTLAPTLAPAPTATPAPTSAASVAPSPSATPTPTRSAAPSATPSPTPAPTAASSSGFVGRTGTKLTLGGQPYTFTGLNIYNANSRDNCWYSMGNNDPVLDNSLTQIGSGQDVFRSWFFQKLATMNGTRDWRAFDHTLSVAAAHGQRVIVTLADQWGACEETDAAIYKDETWYASGYKTIVRSGTVPYRDWVAEIVTRYKDNPTILAWQLMNEAEDAPAKNTPCSSTAAPTLKAWAADVAAVVKSIDRVHLLSIGTSGGGQCGAVYTQYKDLYSLQDVDLCEYHDYGSPTEAMPGDRWNGLLFRIQQCQELNKPIFVGEIGIKTADAGSLSARAADFDAKLNAQFSAGVAGILLWGWRDAAHGGASLTDYDIGANEPTLIVLAKY